MLETILRTGIPTNFSKQLSRPELKSLMRSYGITGKALSDFNNGLITWSEYLDLLESHQINIDSYLSVVSHNLKTIGLD